jgi:pantothenate kinase
MQPTDTGVKKRRTRRDPATTGSKEMTQIDETSARLNTHEAVCSERFLGLDIKMKNIEDRLDKLETTVKELSSGTAKGFSEIKELIEKRNNSSHTAIITAAGSVIVALIAFLGYLITHIK